MCWRAHRDYPPDTDTPRLARAFATDHLSAVLGADHYRLDVTEDAVVVLSELVTNAVQAGSTTLAVDINLHRDHLRLAVTDDADGAPEVLDPTDNDEHGRGLRLVAALARGWGSIAGRSGKQVWAVLSVPPHLTRGVACTVATLV